MSDEVKEPEIPDDYLTVKEVAKRLRITPQAVYQWIEQGRLQAKRFGRRKGLRIPVSEFQRFEEEAGSQSSGRDVKSDEGNKTPRIAAAIHMQAILGI